LKNNFLGFVFFVGDIISRVGLSLFGHSYQALGPTAGGKYFAEFFYWKPS